MPITGVRLDGVKECIASFKTLEPTAKRELGEATRTTLMAIVAAARQRVRVRFGLLQRAIDFSFSFATGLGTVGIRRGVTFVSAADARRRAPNLFALYRQSRPGDRTIRVSPALYAHLVELGTSHSRAFPFMLPAVESQRGPYLQRCRAAGPRIEAAVAQRAAFGFGARAE